MTVRPPSSGFEFFIRRSCRQPHSVEREREGGGAAHSAEEREAKLNAAAAALAAVKQRAAVQCQGHSMTCIPPRIWQAGSNRRTGSRESEDTTLDDAVHVRHQRPLKITHSVFNLHLYALWHLINCHFVNCTISQLVIHSETGSEQ